MVACAAFFLALSSSFCLDFAALPGSSPGGVYDVPMGVYLLVRLPHDSCVSSFFARLNAWLMLLAFPLFSSSVARFFTSALSA